MSAEWRPVEGGFYSVSSAGRVRREVACMGSFPGRLLSIRSSAGHYPSVAIHRDGFVHRRYIHDLVAEAFLGPRPEGAEVNHRNGDKADNRVANLEYVTPSENMAHAARGGLLVIPTPKPGEANPNAKIRECDVVSIRSRADAGDTLHSIASDLGVSDSLVWRVARRKSWRHVS